MAQIRTLSLVIVAFLENATIEYSSVCVCLCLCLCLCVCVCVCVFLLNNTKRNRSRRMKLEYIVVYEKSSEEFGIEHCRIKVKVTVGVYKFPIYHNTNCQVL